MGYSVILRGAEPVSRVEVESYLASLPDMRKGANLYLYSDEEEDVSAEIRLIGEGDRIERLVITVPIEVSEPAAERAATFCMGLARHTGWQVTDEFSGTVLSEGELRRRFEGSRRGVAARGCMPSAVGGVLLLVYLVCVLR